MPLVNSYRKLNVKKGVLVYYRNIVDAMKRKNPEDAWAWFRKDSSEINRLMFVKAEEDINQKGQR